MPASKLNAEATEQVVRLVRAGNVVEVAAAAAGISRSTFFAWMNRGQKSGAANAAHREFREAVIQARAEAEANLVARIAKAAQNGSWSAAAWLLERRAPERWGKPGERVTDEAEDEAEAEVPDADDPIIAARLDLAARKANGAHAPTSASNRGAVEQGVRLKAVSDVD